MSPFNSVPSSVRRRLMRGLAATSLTPLLAAATQLGTVPLFLHAWGAAKYGNWLILSAVPAYLSLSDLGFGSASGSDMTARVAAGDREGALCTFQSSWVLLNSVSVLVLLAVALTVWWLPWRSLLHLSGLASREVALTIALLAIYVLLAQQISVFESGYRCDGHFAIGTLRIALIRFSETFGGCAVGILSGSFVFTALAYLVIRLLGTVAYAELLRRRVAWIRIGTRHARLSRIRHLGRAAIGFIALPIGTALTLQGFTLLLGLTRGPVAVAVFSTMRTLSRLTLQALTAMAHTVWPEFSRAFGAGDLMLAQRLFRRTIQFSIAGSMVCAAGLWTLGPAVYRLWVRHAVAFDEKCFHVLIAAAMANAIWYTGFALPMSNNTHYRLALGYTIATAASLGLALVLVPVLGLRGAAFSISAVDAGMVPFVLRNCLRQIGDTWCGMLAAIARVGATPVTGSIADSDLAA